MRLCVYVSMRLCVSVSMCHVSMSMCMTSLSRPAHQQALRALGRLSRPCMLALPVAVCGKTQARLSLRCPRRFLSINEASLSTRKQPARMKPHAKEHTNNPVQKPHFRGQAVETMHARTPGGSVWQVYVSMRRALVQFGVFTESPPSSET